MDILVIDRDPLTNQLLSARLEAMGHAVTVEANKNEAFEKIKAESFDCILFDPAPLSDALPIVVNILRCVGDRRRPYLILLSKTATEADAVSAFTHNVLHKPFGSQDVETKIGNAKRLIDIEANLATQDDTRSGGGLIGRAAFNQLFLSAMDRAFRYTEKSMIVLISMVNYDDIIATDNMDAAEDIVTRLSEKMTHMRRQSDVIGRLGPHDFGIMLQRPQYESESVDALNRFSEILNEFAGEFMGGAAAPYLDLDLISLPQGELVKRVRVPLSRNRVI